jgi:uncharacterized membrane protein
MAEGKKNIDSDLSSHHEELLLRIYESTKRTERWVRVHALLSVLKLVIFVVPLILAIIYLPPILQSFVGNVQETLKLYQPPSSVPSFIK